MSPCPPDRLNAARALSRISVSPVTSGRGGSLTHGLAAAEVKAPASSAALTATRWKAIAAPPAARKRVRVRHGAKIAPGAPACDKASNGRTRRQSRIDSIGRTWCRERGGKEGEILVGAGTIKKKNR